jgi:Fe-S oxidoreductase
VPMQYQTPKAYREDLCELCGTCLERCPVMKMPAAEARREMALLREGRDARALTECTSCFACDFFCPNDCNPAELILERWRRINAARGLPARARYFLPHSNPNFRTFVLDHMSPRERAIVESWRDLSPAEEVCYPGCNMIVTPLLTRTRALEGLDVRGGLEYCCGEMYFRMGLFDQVREVAKKTQGFFDALGARKVTILCTAGYYLFTRVLPHFGADYKFEMEPYLASVKRRLDSGEIEFKHPLNMKVTIQESCYGKQFGEEYMSLPRELLARAGCEIIEQGPSRECMLCCGIGAGFSPYSAYNPLKLTAYTVRVMREARKSGADAVVAYCSGCVQMFALGKLVYLTGLRAYHLLELLAMAMGEDLGFNHTRFAATMLVGTLIHQGPALLDPRRFKPPPI